MSFIRLLIFLSLLLLGFSCKEQINLSEGWYGIIDSEKKYFELLIQDKSCYFYNDEQFIFKPYACITRSDSLVLQDNPFLFSAKIKDHESYYELNAEHSAKMWNIVENYEVSLSDYIKAIKEKTAQIQSGDFNPALMNETIVLQEKFKTEFLKREQQIKTKKPNS